MPPKNVIGSLVTRRWSNSTVLWEESNLYAYSRSYSDRLQSEPEEEDADLHIRPIMHGDVAMILGEVINYESEKEMKVLLSDGFVGWVWAEMLEELL